MLDHLNEYHDRHGQRLSIKKLREAVRRVMDEEEEEIERNINNITCDTSFSSPVTKSVQKRDASWSLERQLAAGVLFTLRTNIKIVTAKDCPLRSSEKLFVTSWMRKKKKWDVT